MLWRRSQLPEGLVGQALACAAVASEAARFFRAPSEAGAYAVHQAGLRAQQAAAIAAERGARRSEWLRLSRRLDEAAQEQVASAKEASRFGVADVAGLAKSSASLHHCGRELGAALEVWGRSTRCEAGLLAAKRWAQAAARCQRRARQAALDTPNAVLDLKVRTVLRRLSAATEAWQQAADCLAEILVGEVK